MDEQHEDVEWHTADAGAVRQFLLERHSFLPDLVEKALKGFIRSVI